MKFLILIFLLTSCSRFSLSDPEKAMRETAFSPLFDDRLSDESFFKALDSNIAVLKRKDMNQFLKFGNEKITIRDYVKSLEKIKDYQNSNWKEYIKNNFKFLEVYGRDDWGEVFLTGYYEPVVMGSKTYTERYDTPLYRTPPEFKKGKQFYDRKSIDQDLILKDKNLEIAWVNSIDAFFIQIQGSAVIDLSNNERIRVGYENKNGHSYVPIGKFLTDVIPKENMSMQTIKNYLKTLNKNDLQELLNKNPSYVFFTKLNGEAMTSLGAPAFPGRTIATDAKYFPKGAMCFLDVFEPKYEEIEDINSNYYLNRPRIVFDQDTGGAIKGGGRVDLFFGTGAYFEQKAGGYKNLGRLYYLFPIRLN